MKRRETVIKNTILIDISQSTSSYIDFIINFHFLVERKLFVQKIKIWLGRGVC